MAIIAILEGFKNSKKIDDGDFYGGRECTNLRESRRQ